MFSVGETIVYGTNGVCEIKEISRMKFGSKTGEYYVLSPVNDPRSVLYVPTGNEKLTAKMRPLLSKTELCWIIDEVCGDALPWISDDAGRKSYCDSVVKAGDRRELMRLISMLYLRREELKNNKKHFHNIDAQYLKTAEHMLNDEFSHVLGISADDVPEFIRMRILSAGAETV